MKRFSLIARGLSQLTLPLMIVTLTVGVATSGEGTKKLNTETTAGKVELNPAVNQASLGLELAFRGEKARSPVMMLAAAELMAGLKPGPNSANLQDIKFEEPASKRLEAERDLRDVTGLLLKARKYAAGDQQLSRLVTTRLERPRGLTPTPQTANLKGVVIKGTEFKVLLVSKLLPGKYTELSNVRFQGQERAVVLVVGDGDGDLDLFVHDENSGGLIGKDTDSTSMCEVQWTPRYTGPFKLRIANVGRQWEKYAVLANW